MTHRTSAFLFHASKQLPYFILTIIVAMMAYADGDKKLGFSVFFAGVFIIAMMWPIGWDTRKAEANLRSESEQKYDECRHRYQEWNGSEGGFFCLTCKQKVVRSTIMLTDDNENA